MPELIDPLAPALAVLVLEEQARLRSASVPAHALLRAGRQLRIEVGRVVAAPASAASRDSQLLRRQRGLRASPCSA